VFWCKCTLLYDKDFRIDYQYSLLWYTLYFISKLKRFRFHSLEFKSIQTQASLLGHLITLVNHCKFNLALMFVYYVNQPSPVNLIYSKELIPTNKSRVEMIESKADWRPITSTATDADSGSMQCLRKCMFDISLYTMISMSHMHLSLPVPICYTILTMQPHLLLLESSMATVFYGLKAEREC